MNSGIFKFCISMAAFFATVCGSAHAQRIEIDGPIRLAPGSTTGLPVSLRPGEAFGQYALVKNVPEWASLSDAEKVGDGIYLVRVKNLRDVKVTVTAAAKGRHSISIAAVKPDGSVGWQGDIIVEVGEQPPAPSSTSLALSAASAPAKTRNAAAKAVPATKKAPPAKTAQVAGQCAVTWERLLNNNLTGPVTVPKSPAQPKAAPANAATRKRSSEELAGLARNVVRECTTCHNLYGQDVGIPVMVGLTYDRFMETMYLYRTKKRDHQAMTVVAQSLSEEETEALALYLGRIKPLAPGEDANAVASAPGDGNEALETARRRTIDSAKKVRVERWITRASGMLDEGDIAQARLLLERATEYGHPRAAFLLATSFDPNALPWRIGIGMAAEPLVARRWYAHAKSLGAGPEVDARLADLPAPRRVAR